MDPDFAEMDQPEDASRGGTAWDRYAEKLFVADAPILTRLSPRSACASKTSGRPTRPSPKTRTSKRPRQPEPARPDFADERRAGRGISWSGPGRDLPPETAAGRMDDFQEAVRRALRL